MVHMRSRYQDRHVGMNRDRKPPVSRDTSPVYYVISLCLGICLGVGATLYVGDGIDSPPLGGTGQQPVRENSTAYRFIDPLIECETEVAATPRIKLFKTKLDALIARMTKQYGYESVSVYFRDLSNGPWYGLSYDEPFVPASLVKVPILIAVLKQAETKPALLQDRVLITDDMEHTLSQNIATSSGVRSGVEYSIQELLEHMIIYSDNTAVKALRSYVNEDVLADTFAQIGVPFNLEDSGDLRLTVREYAAFFRVLYNASYLTREYSELALSILSQSSFTQGIVQGVPSYIPVAHKFGERQMVGDGYTVQFHDCGIVYYPEHPYLLCVMSRGDSLAELQSTVREVSKLFYDEVHDQFGSEEEKS